MRIQHLGLFPIEINVHLKLNLTYSVDSLSKLSTEDYKNDTFKS